MNTWAYVTAGAIALSSALPATAAVFVAEREVGQSDIYLSITTDGTLGVLTASNIIDYEISGFSINGNFIFTPGNSDVQVEGTAFSATTTDLLFDFEQSSSLSFFLIQSHFPIIRGPYYCLNNTDCTSPNDIEVFSPGPGDLPFFRDLETRAGVLVVASAAAVPEPATWAMMIAGFGAVGAAMRRRRSRTILVTALGFWTGVGRR